MPKYHKYDAIVVGSGPNGLAAAITLARAGRSALVLEAEQTIGGGTRSMELTLPGFVHDVCSAIHPLAAGSPFFRMLSLEQYGLEWIYPAAELAHPLDDGTAVMLERSVDATAAGLGSDADAYRRLMKPLVADWETIAPVLLGPRPIPRHPLALARFGVVGIRSAQSVAKRRFAGERARALFAGMAAHSILRLDQLGTAGFGLVLGVLGHRSGWPVARGGSQHIADALRCYLASLGGEIEVGMRVESLDDLPQSRAVLLDVTPRQLLKIAGARLRGGYRRQLESYRYGPGIFKLDWALDAPIPWTASGCGRAATVHLGGTIEEIAASEHAVWAGEHSDQPFVILAQQSLVDPTRAPEGKHTAWAYCHVPNGSGQDMTDRIEAQVERFAPGFKQHILARSVMGPARMQQHDANYIGGDINGGVQDFRQFYTRPAIRLNPYSTPLPGIFLCSSSTPPGGGVHGLCGYFAASAAMSVTSPGR